LVEASVPRQKKERKMAKRLENRTPRQIKHAEYMVEWYKKHPGYNTANVKRWRQERGGAERRRKAWSSVTRMGISTEWREALIKHMLVRDGNLCGICHVPMIPGDETIDHIVSDNLGGGSEPENLQLAHPVCNNRKGTGDPSAPGKFKRDSLRPGYVKKINQRKTSNGWRCALVHIISRRDGWACGICGECLPANANEISIARKIANCLGGENSVENFFLSHKSCNFKRGAEKREAKCKVSGDTRSPGLPGNHRLDR
jgi:5-methylcytosine-specific restriction endonuclease McrA